jgi:hypothetical protein
LVKDNDILTIWSNTCDSDINLESALAGEIWELKKEVISDFPSNSVLNVGLGAMGATRGNQNSGELPGRRFLAYSVHARIEVLGKKIP